MTDIEENNFHIVMRWSRLHFMFSKIHPTISVRTEGLVRAAFTILQEKKSTLEETLSTHALTITTTNIGGVHSLLNSRLLSYSKSSSARITRGGHHS